MRLFPAILVSLLVPAILMAAEPRAGTDEYLRDVLKLTDEERSSELPTEKREPFETATGPQTIEDPLGDVVSRFGATSSMQEPWGDIESVTLSKNDADQTWDVTTAVGGVIPERPAGRAQFFFYADEDADAEDNDPNGIGGGLDAEFSVQYNQENGWYADFRWYNQEADFWGLDRTTSSTFEINGSTIVLRIPFDELSDEREPRWRAVAAAADGSKTQVDVTPGIGFPPSLGGTPPKPPLTERIKAALPEFTPALGILLATLAAAAAYVAWIFFGDRIKRMVRKD